jgi:hypothetical protein
LIACNSVGADGKVNNLKVLRGLRPIRRSPAHVRARPQPAYRRPPRPPPMEMTVPLVVSGEWWWVVKY